MKSAPLKYTKSIHVVSFTRANETAWIDLVYFRGADFKNLNHFYFYGHNFAKSEIPVFSLFSLYNAYKWPSCALQMTLRSYGHRWSYGALNDEHIDIGYMLVCDNPLVKQWSVVYQSDYISAVFHKFCDIITYGSAWKNIATKV